MLKELNIFIHEFCLQHYGQVVRKSFLTLNSNMQFAVFHTFRSFPFHGTFFSYVLLHQIIEGPVLWCPSTYITFNTEMQSLKYFRIRSPSLLISVTWYQNVEVKKLTYIADTRLISCVCSVLQPLLVPSCINVKGTAHFAFRLTGFQALRMIKLNRKMGSTCSMCSGVRNTYRILIRKPEQM